MTEGLQKVLGDALEVFLLKMFDVSLPDVVRILLILSVLVLEQGVLRGLQSKAVGHFHFVPHDHSGGVVLGLLG